jgi:hypothetical protein
MEFLVQGAVRYGEPGVCMDFEETKEKLAFFHPLGLMQHIGRPC